MKLKTLPIFFAFLCMGFGDAVNSFVGIAKEKFALDNFEANLIAFAGYIMFGLLSVPMGVCMDKIGKKSTLMAGLVLELLGVGLVLVLGVNQFTIFLMAILLLGAGSTILQVSGNPIMRDVSDEGQYSSNLSMGQFVKAIGSFTAPAVFTVAALKGYTEKECWPVLLPIFAGAIAISIFSVATLKIRETKADAKSASLGSCLALLANPFVFAMVLGIFLYVGAEVCMASGLPVYFKAKFGFTPELATQFVTYFFIAIMAGRFFGAMILKRMAPKAFLVAASVFSLLGFVLLALGSKGLSIAALFIIALGFANIFPLIFSITIDKMPEKSSELSGLMITAICGGAFIPLLMGKLADSCGNLAGFAIPALCIVYILAAGLIVKTAKNS
ncbi:MAG: MFS transporter [Opitutales bacterium]|nr:MFS transporter [Opitutales bacterium]